MSDDPAKPPVRDIERDVGKLGVMVNHLLYDALDLRAPAGERRGLRVRVLVDPRDVGTVVAVLPDGTRKRLDAVHAAYAKGLGLEEHLSNLRAARGGVSLGMLSPTTAAIEHDLPGRRTGSVDGNGEEKGS